LPTSADVKSPSEVEEQEQEQEQEEQEEGGEVMVSAERL